MNVIFSSDASCRRANNITDQKVSVC